VNLNLDSKHLFALLLLVVLVLGVGAGWMLAPEKGEAFLDSTTTRLINVTSTATLTRTNVTTLPVQIVTVTSTMPIQTSTKVSVTTLPAQVVTLTSTSTASSTSTVTSTTTLVSTRSAQTVNFTKTVTSSTTVSTTKTQTKPQAWTAGGATINPPLVVDSVTFVVNGHRNLLQIGSYAAVSPDYGLIVKAVLQSNNIFGATFRQIGTVKIDSQTYEYQIDSWGLSSPC